MSTPTAAERYTRGRLQLIRSLATNAPVPATTIDKLLEAEREVESQYSEADAEFVFRRAEQAVGEVFSGKPAPPLAQHGRDSIARVETDYQIEQIVTETKARGWRPLTADKWKQATERLERTKREYARCVEMRPIIKAAEMEIQRANQPRAKRKPTVSFDVLKEGVDAAVEASGEAIRKAFSEQAHIVGRFEDGELVLRLEFDSEVKGKMVGRETRVALPGQPTNIADAFAGTWTPREYKRGTFVVRDGSTWLTLEDTRSKPGDGDAWRLIARAGRDGRDRARPTST